ncbi:tachykinin-like peptides receptor 86C [Brevipalpus obovatus]|uniref:tachykinin-like peptides receptor 86C n=1 Tax=Brevipalpus obovatus TaxID=246614 RepID=UPI003D9DE08A
MNISYDLEESCPGILDSLSKECFIPKEEKSDCILQYRNLSELKPAQDAYVIPFGVKLIWILAYTAMIIISVSGNSIIIWIILGHRKMRTVTNIFILNLSIADLIISLFNTTFNFIFMISGHWYFGYFFCKINNFLVYLTLTASIFTIMAVSIERYRIVVVPMKPRISKNGCIKWLLLIWLIAALISLPTLVYAQYETFGDLRGDPSARHICFLEWPDGGPGCSKWDLMYNLVIFLMDYAIPMVIMGVTYFKIGKIFWANHGIGELTTSQHEAIKSRKRVVSMLLSLTIVFAICWLPYHAFFLYVFFDPLFLYSKFISNIYLGTFFLAMSNSAINPIIYALLSRRYRNYFVKLLPFRINWRHEKDKSLKTSQRTMEIEML